jgi:hypothetical protein
MNPFNRLTNPRYPSVALGLEKGSAAAVSLERTGQGRFGLRRAAMIALPEAVLTPGFDTQNIVDVDGFAALIKELVTGAGLLRERKWSVTLPEAAARAVIVTMESATGSRAEQDEVLRWKVERAFGAPFDEMRISREAISPDGAGRRRFLTVGTRWDVLAEYEAVMAKLGWRAGMVLPRQIGESQWLFGSPAMRMLGDTLLLSSHEQGFTAVLVRDGQPLVIRSVLCEREDYEDELFRLMLFYRDRIANDTPDRVIDAFLLLGPGFTASRVSEIINETLGATARVLGAEDVGLTLPGSELSFDALAAPAGLATLAWA